MDKFYVGQLSRAVTHFNHTDKPAKVELVFNNGDFGEEMPFKLDHEYYVIEKSELDAYMARPVFAENQRLKAKINALEAKITNLTEINKALGEENSKLAEENKALVERNAKLKTRLNKFYGMTPVGEELRAANETLKAENAYLTRLNGDFLKERSKLVEENKVLKERLNKFYSMCLDVMVMSTSSSSS